MLEEFGCTHVSAFEHPVTFTVFVYLVPKSQSDQGPPGDILQKMRKVTSFHSLSMSKTNPAVPEIHSEEDDNNDRLYARR